MGVANFIGGALGGDVPKFPGSVAFHVLEFFIVLLENRVRLVELVLICLGLLLLARLEKLTNKIFDLLLRCPLSPKFHL